MGLGKAVIFKDLLLSRTFCGCTFSLYEPIMIVGTLRAANMDSFVCDIGPYLKKGNEIKSLP